MRAYYFMTLWLVLLVVGKSRSWIIPFRLFSVPVPPAKRSNVIVKVFFSLHPEVSGLYCIP